MGPLRSEEDKMNISDLRQKAERGSAVAQTILGTYYLEGVDVEVDYNEAFSIFVICR
jgi:TPR repeat protein